MKEIKTIMEGPNKFGTLHRSHKRRIRVASRLEELQQQIQAVRMVYQAERCMKVSLKFTDADIQDVQYPHNDVLIVIAGITNHNVHRY